MQKHCFYQSENDAGDDGTAMLNEEGEVGLGSSDIAGKHDFGRALRKQFLAG